MLSDRCLSVCLSVCPVLPVCLSVTFVHCGQTVGRIKMKLGTQVGLGPGHIVLDGDPVPLPQRGTAPKFSAHICCGQMELGLGPSHFVLDGDPAPLLPKRGRRPPKIRPMFIVVIWLDG